MEDGRVESSSSVLLPWILSLMNDMEKEGEKVEGSIGAEKTPGRPFDVVVPPLMKVSTVQEVINAVNTARQQKVTLRTTGAEHSAPNAIFPESPGGVTLRLCDELRHVHCMREAVEDGKKVAYFKIGAGCYLGHNVSDSSSTLENSACYQINALGYAFPILGGMSHQSVGGFMMNGICWRKLAAWLCRRHPRN